MISQIRCIKCSGQVIERNGLDGMELLCLNCGFGQIPNIIPTQALADDSEDYQLRNRSDGWSDTYYNLHGTRGESGKTNRLGTNNKKQYQLTKQKNKPKRIDTKQKVTKETIDTWNRIKGELELTSQEVNKGSNK